MSNDATSERAPVGILDIPPELITAIVQNLDQDQPRTYYSDLVRLTHTSSYLRQASLNASVLWTTVDITDNPASFELAKACLNRSGNQPLDLSIRIRRKLKSRLNGLLAFVSFTSPRLRSLDLRVCLSDLREELAQIQQCFSQLETPQLLYLHVEIVMLRQYGMLPHHSVPIPQKAFQLRSLHLSNTTPDVTPGSLLSSIKTITFSSRWFWEWPYPTFVNALRACEALENLTVTRTACPAYGFLRSPDSLPTTVPIVLPNLRRLTIRDVENDFVAFLLVHIVAPELEEVALEQIEGLSVGDYNLRFDWGGMPILRTLDSVVSLRVEVRQVVVFNKDGLAEFLVKVFPQIECLDIPWKSGKEIIRAWTSSWTLLDPATARMPWPNLRQMSVISGDGTSCMGDCPLLLEHMSQLLQTRKRLGLPPLEQVEFDVCEDLKQWEGYRASFRRLCRALSSTDSMDMTVVKQRSEGCTTYRPELL